MDDLGYVDKARATLSLLKVVAIDVILPSRLGRRGDFAVAPRPWDLRSSFVEAGAWFTLVLEVTSGAFPKPVGVIAVTAPVAWERG
jgi:hypothetical protein